MQLASVGCLMAEMVTASALAPLLGVTRQAIDRARDAGRLTCFDGKYNVELARIEFARNRQRQRAGKEPAVPPAGAEVGAAASGGGGGADFWDAKTRRETAEASIAELKEAELRGELVRRVVVERELASQLVALRESLEVLADRLAAVMAAETDAAACRNMLRNEHRLALASFAKRIETTTDAPAGEGDDGGA